MSKDFKAFVDKMEKLHGEGSVFRGSEGNSINVEKLSSGSYKLNGALGGGYPKGRIVEIYGHESSGKTTLTLHAIAEAQKEGGLCGFIDAEHALDLDYAEKLGVDKGDLVISQPDFGEQALSILDSMLDSGLFSLIIIDSVAALTPKAELEGEMGDSKMGLQARLMSQALRKITAKVNKSDTLVIFINQIREKIGVMFGNPETTTGGNALKFYASQRLEIRRSKQDKDKDGNVIGNDIKIKVVKNKVAPPFAVAETKILYNVGISLVDEIIDVAVDQGVIKKSGSWYSYGDTKLGQGQDNVRILLQDNHELQEEIIEKLSDS